MTFNVLDDPTHTGYTLGDLVDLDAVADDRTGDECGNCRVEYDDKSDCPIVEDANGKHYAACPNCGWHASWGQMAIEAIEDDLLTDEGLTFK